MGAETAAGWGSPPAVSISTHTPAAWKIKDKGASVAKAVAQNGAWGRRGQRDLATRVGHSIRLWGHQEESISLYKLHDLEPVPSLSYVCKQAATGFLSVLSGLQTFRCRNPPASPIQAHAKLARVVPGSSRQHKGIKRCWALSR